MRTDVKLGVFIALGAVLLAGGYYLKRDREAKPIKMDGKSVADAAKEAAKSKEDAAKSAGKNAQKNATPASAKRNPTTTADRSAKRTPARTPARRTANARPTTAEDRSGTKPSGTKIPTTNHARRNDPGRSSTTPNAQRTTPAQRQAAARRNLHRRDTPGQPSRDANDGDESKAAAKTADAGSNAAQAAADKESSTPATTPAQARHRTAGAPDAAQRADANRTAAARNQQTAPRHATRGARLAREDKAVESHKIEAGQSFASLAKMYYGDEKFTQLLIDANPQITDPRRLSVGMTIKIPELPSSERNKRAEAGQPANTATPAKEPDAGSRTYTVRSGDTFYGIAERELGDASRWSELYKLNKSTVGDNPARLRVGQVIVLPSS